MTGQSAFARTLNRRQVVALAFGAMIGWGWVLLTGDWLMRAGTVGTALAFVLGGFAVLLISLTYAELAAAMPEAGGEHVYTYRALGYTPSFIASWAIVMAYITVCTFESAALPTALEFLFPGLRQGYLYSIGGSGVYASFVAVGVAGAVAMTTINVLGISFAAFFQTLVTSLLFIAGGLFLAGVLGHGQTPDGVAPVANGVAGVAGVLVMVPALMVGFDVIPQSAEEINLPQAQIGRMLILSVCMAVAWYIGIAVAVGYTLPADELASTTMATAVAMREVWDSPFMAALMIVAGVGGILTSWNAFIIGGSRVLFALAESGMIPPVFARMHPKYRTPYISIIFIGLLSCVSPFFGRTILIWLVDAGSFMVVIAYILVTIAFIRLRQKEPDMERPFKVRAGMSVGILALLTSLFLGMLFMPFSPSALLWPQEWAMVLGGALLGLCFYTWSVRRGRGT